MTASKSKTSPRVTIEVTQEVIDTSTQRDSSHCMIADALAKAVPNAKFISVDLATIRFTDLAAGRRYIYLTPRKAQEALLAFDQGEKPEPFTLRIAGAHVLATGNANKARTTLEKSTRGGNAVPERNGGLAPPLGPLPGGAPKQRRGKVRDGAGAGNRTGRRREFGLRAIIR
jgi:hypothetical protein